MGNDQNITLKDSATNASRANLTPDNVYGTWQHICFVRKNAVGFGYKNGKRNGTPQTWVDDLTNTEAILTIGRGLISGSGDSDKSKIALVRIGANAPTDEQLFKIYNDESKLFKENAKCTLYGGADAVTALAFDSSNDTLHVGTSAGRSDFNGLVRINNTTTAVTTAISASNGLIAEQ